MARLMLDGIGKTFPDGTRAVDELDLAVADGELVVLVGPSGCGKTTVLRMVAGLEDVTDGVVKIGERVVNYVPARDRDVAMVFQNYALYPQLDVAGNIGFGLKMRKTPKVELLTRVERTASTLGLADLLARKPGQLSGGQRQRVAMGRAIARQPQLFLMDEPLSNLDAKLRTHMRAEIARLQHDLGVTTLYVTHDQVEAMTMGDRIAVMRRGHLQQYGTPQELYDRPANLFVASFLGNPAMNLLKGRLVRSNGGLAARVGQSELRLPGGVLRPADADRYEGREIGVGLRPEHLKPEGDASSSLAGSVVVVEPLGSELLAHVEVDAEQVLTDAVLEGSTIEGGEEPLLSTLGERTSTVIGRFDPDVRLAAGDRVQLAVNTGKLHLFDLESGEAIFRQ